MSEILDTDNFSKEKINALIHGEAHILSLQPFYTEKVCDILKRQILSRLRVGHYENAPLIGRIGMAFFESIHNPEKRYSYYKNANKWNNDLFDACYPYVSPISKLLNDLKRSWGKANVAQHNFTNMFAGLARVFEEGSSAEPHQDIFLRDAPDIFDKFKIKEQLSFNIYLSVPESGGELEIWNWKATDEEFHKYKNLNPDLAYGMDRSKIPEPDIVYKPKKGDILIFNSRYVHAVAPSYGSQRLTISSFIGYKQDCEELVLWS